MAQVVFDENDVEVRSMDQRNVEKLCNLLNAQFNDYELRDLAITFGIYIDKSKGRSSKAKLRILVQKIQQGGQEKDFIDECRELRPNTKWPEPKH